MDIRTCRHAELRLRGRYSKLDGFLLAGSSSSIGSTRIYTDCHMNASLRGGRLRLLQHRPICRSISYYNKSASSIDTTLPPSFTTLHRLPSVRSPIVFALGASSLAFLAAAALTNEDTETQLSAVVAQNRWRTSISSADLAKERSRTLVKNAQQRLSLMKEYGLSMRFSLLLNEGWINLSESQRTCALLIGINTAVFAAWQIRRYLHVYKPFDS